MPKAYSFFNNTETDEKHIFEGEFTVESCNALEKSICKKATRSKGNWINKATCLSESDAREKAATIGRGICGVCVSHLYTTY
jgi:hypothetical protein